MSYVVWHVLVVELPQARASAVVAGTALGTCQCRLASPLCVAGVCVCVCVCAGVLCEDGGLQAQLWRRHSTLHPAVLRPFHPPRRETPVP